jgi:hypothetical protein
MNQQEQDQRMNRPSYKGSSCLGRGPQVTNGRCKWSACWTYSTLLKMEALCSSKTSVNLYQTSGQQIPKDSTIVTSYVGVTFYRGHVNPKLSIVRITLDNPLNGPWSTCFCIYPVICMYLIYILKSIYTSNVLQFQQQLRNTWWWPYRSKHVVQQWCENNFKI